jgi:hypothetical protein
VKYPASLRCLFHQLLHSLDDIARLIADRSVSRSTKSRASFSSSVI